MHLRSNAVRLCTSAVRDEHNPPCPLTLWALACWRGFSRWLRMARTAPLPPSQAGAAGLSKDSSATSALARLTTGVDPPPRSSCAASTSSVDRLRVRRRRKAPSAAGSSGPPSTSPNFSRLSASATPGAGPSAQLVRGVMPAELHDGRAPRDVARDEARPRATARTVAGAAAAAHLAPRGAGLRGRASAQGGRSWPSRGFGRVG